MELVGNRSFTLITANGKQIRDPSTQPFIFNIYTSDLSTTVSEKYLYVNDLAITNADGDW